LTMKEVTETRETPPTDHKPTLLERLSGDDMSPVMMEAKVTKNHLLSERLMSPPFRGSNVKLPH